MTATIAAVLVGAVVVAVMYVWRFPASGVDTQPPVCSNTFGVIVPCGSETTVLAIIALVGIAAGVFTFVGVRRLPPPRIRQETRAS